MKHSFALSRNIMKKNNNRTLPLTSKNPDWLKMTKEEQKVFDMIIGELLCFFVLYSPCPGYCTQGRDLQYYGWDKKPWLSNKYLKDKLDAQFIDPVYIKSGNKREEMQSVFIKSGLLDNNIELASGQERIAVLMTESSLYMSVFYHIRCALAHGRVSLRLKNGKRILLMENGVNYGKEFAVKARIILNYETIKGWINVIQNGPAEKRKTYETDIITLIEENPHITTKQMTKAIRDTKYMVNKGIEQLKKSQVITYVNKGKNGYWRINYNNKDKFLKNEVKDTEQ